MSTVDITATLLYPAQGSHAIAVIAESDGKYDGMLGAIQTFETNQNPKNTITCFVLEPTERAKPFPPRPLCRALIKIMGYLIRADTLHCVFCIPARMDFPEIGDAELKIGSK